MYGLALNGEDGVEEVLRGIHADTEITLGLSGFNSLEDVHGRREEIMTKLVF
jgi:lactate 2-monooxygenase